jgi:hypothetical protein
VTQREGPKPVTSVHSPPLERKVRGCVQGVARMPKTGELVNDDG